MKVCIIGWYGTETIGDRAILSGILSFLAEAFDDLTVSLGCLYPFFSERTVAEDQTLWDSLACRSIDVSLFDSTKKPALKRAVREADLLLLGGGPIMDLREMHLLAYGFRCAHRHRVKSMVFGCGVGPLMNKEYQKAAFDILSKANVSIFRDHLAQQAAVDLFGEKHVQSWSSAVDPAAYCAHLYKQSGAVPDPVKRITINFRRIYAEYGANELGTRFEGFAVDLVQKVMDDYPEYKVELVPNHYFFAGHDDRSFLNMIKYRTGSRELRVQNRPLSLRETMDRYGSSACCVGMRFHAVVLMAMLNGRCRIVNYTGARKGKIAGFLADFDPRHYFDSGRMVSLDEAEWNLSAFEGMMSDAPFEPDMARMEAAFDLYRKALTNILN